MRGGYALCIRRDGNIWVMDSHIRGFKKAYEFPDGPCINICNMETNLTLSAGIQWNRRIGWESRPNHNIAGYSAVPSRDWEHGICSSDWYVSHIRLVNASGARICRND
jgi:hypothetical protein